MLTVDQISLWELAHRLAGEDPYRKYWLRRVPQDVKDWCRTLLNEIISLHLESSLITAKADGEENPEFYIRTYLDEIYGCIAGTKYPAKFLKFVQVTKWDYRDWCERSGRQLPEFWFGADYRWPADESDDPRWAESAAKQFAKDPETAQVFLRQSLERDDLYPKIRMRYEAMLSALDLWIEDPDRPIAQVARALWDEGHGKNKVELRTIESWIREIAPENVRNKPGRRKKKPSKATKLDPTSKT